MSVLWAVVVIAGIVALATVIGVIQRARQGRIVRTPQADGAVASADESTRAPVAADRSEADTEISEIVEQFGTLGERATLVQFSTEFCANCPSARRTLRTISEGREGFSFVEIDVGERLDIARSAHVMKTPTVLVLGPRGESVARIVGPPRRADLQQLVDTL